jgi:hypothetical protein
MNQETILIFGTVFLIAAVNNKYSIAWVHAKTESSISNIQVLIFYSQKNTQKKLKKILWRHTH